MLWTVQSDERVADAVVASFFDTAERSRARISALSLDKWERSYHWLIASGLTLYFLDLLQTLNIESALPEAMLARLRQNLSDHRERSAFMMAEFVTVNRAFLNAGIRYCNLKGFTLSPGYCPDPALRSQMDIDLLVDGRQLGICRDTLIQLGYSQTTETQNEWEFKTSSSEIVKIDDHFKTRRQCTIELHFSTEGPDSWEPSCDERLCRLEQRAWASDMFPVLRPEDQFAAQALHLLQHLRSPSTRLAWVLEYKRFVSAHEEDSALWEEVRHVYEQHPEAHFAIGLASTLANQIFGGNTPALLNRWTLDRLPENIKLWTDVFGRKALFAGPPGTKLYLILDAELADDDAIWALRKRNKLLPLRSKAPQIICAPPNENLRQRIRRELYQMAFILFRIRFHLVEDVRYLHESQRWRRLLAAPQGRLVYGGLEQELEQETELMTESQ